MTNKLKIAWFSKLNLQGEQSDSLGAYVSDMLLPLLRSKFDITLFHNSFETYADYPTQHFLKAFETHQKNPFDIFFYNLENKAYANFVRSHIGLIPGITYFHDFILSNYGPEPLLNSPYQNIVTKYNDKTDRWPERDAKHKPKGPQAYREAVLSPVTIFTNEQNLNEYRSSVDMQLKVENGDNLNAFYLPYAVKSRDIKNTLSKENNIIAFASSTQIEGRAHKLFSALSSLDREYKLIWMVTKEEQQVAQSLLQEFTLNEVELVVEKSPEIWCNIVNRASIAVHTHFSVYGHLQPYLGISLMAGLPCLVSNFGSAEYLSDKLVFKIQSGQNEAYEITQVLREVIDQHVEIDPDRIKSYAREIFDADQVAIELAKVFTEKAQYLEMVLKRWNEVEMQARDFLLSESVDIFTSSVSAEGTEAIATATGAFKSFIEPIFQELNWENQNSARSPSKDG